MYYFTIFKNKVKPEFVFRNLQFSQLAVTGITDVIVTDYYLCRNIKHLHFLTLTKKRKNF